MHDVLEGIAQYDLAQILHEFIQVQHFFTLMELNDLIRGFEYGQHQNKPPEILKRHIDEKRIIMTASEMLCLIRHIRLIIGHFVPLKNKTWALLK